MTTIGFIKDREINVCNCVNLSVHLILLIQWLKDALSNNLFQCYANKLNTVWTEGDYEVLNWQESDSEQAIKEKVMYQIKLCVPMVCMFHTILWIMHYRTALGFLSHDNLVVTWSQFKVVLTTILCLRHFHKKMFRISWGIQLKG